jgi:hypothetical protein
MASSEMAARLQGLSAGELKLLAQGFGQRPKNGAEAAEYLAALPDDQIAAALALLPAKPEPAASPAPTVEAPTSPPAEVSPIPPAPTVEAPPPVATPAKPEAAPALQRISVKNRTEATYNGHTFVFSPKPDECTPLPPVVAAYFKAYFDDNGVRFRAF